VIVLVPAYEPDARLVALLDALRTAVPGAHLLVVDDGSGPAFAPVFDAARQRGCVVLTHPVNRGKGAALRTGFRYAVDHHPGADVVCADSDGQHSPTDVLRVAARLRDGGELVLGVRAFTGFVPLRSRFGNAVTRTLFRLATGQDVRDTQTGLRAYAAPLLTWLLSVPGDRFEYELNVLLQAVRRRLPIDEIEIDTIYLEGNASSHFHPVVDSLRIYGPLLPFLLSSLGAFVIDAAALLVLHALTGGLLVSVAGARLFSASANFVVNRRFVFRAAAPGPGASAVRYAALAAVLLGANYGLMAIVTGMGLALLPAKLLTEVGLVAISYLTQRHVVFAHAHRQPGQERRCSTCPGRVTAPGAPGAAPEHGTAGQVTITQTAHRC
jgi:glycosyltransferase involved in cell wall biosynthesis